MLGDISHAEHIYIAVGYTDMRKQIDGLSAIVQQNFKLDPFSNSLFLFYGRNTKIMKALYWEGDGFVRHEVIYEPAKLYVKDIYRKTYECRNCRKNGKGVMLKAGTPKPAIPHSFTSPSVLSQVIIDKYVNHMPLYRQESEWKRLGLELSRTTMANCVIIATKEYFIPIVNRMHELMMQESHIHCDETPVQVLNESGKKATSRSYMCGYIQVSEKVKDLLRYLSISLTEKPRIHNSS